MTIKHGPEIFLGHPVVMLSCGFFRPLIYPWQGGVELGKKKDFLQSYCVTRAEYEEHGRNICAKKFENLSWVMQKKWRSLQRSNPYQRIGLLEHKQNVSYNEIINLLLSI